MNPYRLRAYILLIAVSVIWGIAAPVIKFTLRGIDPISFLTYRFFLAAVLGILFVLLFARKHLTQLKHNSTQIILYSLFATVISLGLLFLGLERTTVLDAVLIGTVAPLVTAISGVLFLKERITNQEKLGISIAFLGTLITVIEPIITKADDLFQLTGNLFVLGYLLTNGYASVLAKKLVRRDIEPFTLSNISWIVGFLAIFFVALVKSTPAELVTKISGLPLPYHLGVIYMAFISGTLAYSLWIKGQKTIEVSEAGVFAYLLPVFSAPLAVFWLGEKITPPFVIGAILITIGVIIAEYKKRAQGTRQQVH